MTPYGDDTHNRLIDGMRLVVEPPFMPATMWGRERISLLGLGEQRRGGTARA